MPRAPRTTPPTPFAAAPTPEPEAAFLHLEELVSALPALEAEAALLARARALAGAAELKGRAAVLEREYEAYQAIYAEALDRAGEARVDSDSGSSSSSGLGPDSGSDSASGSDAGEAQALGTARAYGELIAVRTAPLKRAQQRYHEALRQLDLADDDALEAALSDKALPSPAECAERQQRVDAFRQDYEQTYHYCKSLADAD